MIANIASNLFLNIKENFWFSGDLSPDKSKMILLLKVMCGPDTAYNK